MLNLLVLIFIKEWFMNKDRRKISVIIPTFNVQDIVVSAIASVKWADEILIVDSFSTDNTVEIAEKMGAKVFSHEYVYSAKQKNWAIPKAKYDWILLLDSDEVVTEKLKNRILELLKSDEIENYDGFGIARKHFFFGRFLRYGGRYPLYNVRLFRKTCRYEDRDVHAHIILDKNRMRNIDFKDGDILHFSDRNFSQFFERFDRYSTYQANYLKKVKQRGIRIDWTKFFTNFFYFKATIKDLWFFLPLAAFRRFVYMYFFRLGFLDGRHGLLIAVLYAMQDYVSKTKYYAMADKKVYIRNGVQNQMIKRLSYLLKIGNQGEMFVKSFQEKYTTSS